MFKYKGKASTDSEILSLLLQGTATKSPKLLHCVAGVEAVEKLRQSVRLSNCTYFMQGNAMLREYLIGFHWVHCFNSRRVE